MSKKIILVALFVMSSSYGMSSINDFVNDFMQVVAEELSDNFSPRYFYGQPVMPVRVVNIAIEEQQDVGEVSDDNEDDLQESGLHFPFCVIQ